MMPESERDQKIAELEKRLQAREASNAPSPPPKQQTKPRGVFILGSPRSGTSVLSWTLAAHPGFTTSAESDYLLDLLGRGHMHYAYKQAVERPDIGWLRKEEVGYSEFASFIGRGVADLYQSRSGEKRWVDATPGYTAMAELPGAPTQR